MYNHDFPYYLTSFLSKYLPGQKNASRNTILSYADTFKLLLNFYDTEKGIKPERLDLSRICSEGILEFLDWLERTRNCSVTTRNQRLVAIHSFCHYVQVQSPENLYDIQKILHIPYKKCAKTVVSYLTGDEMKILLAQPDIQTAKGRRDLVLLATLYDTAARVQELIDLKEKDIRLTKPLTMTLHGKGNKTRQIPISGKTAALLDGYLRSKRSDTGFSSGDRNIFFNQKNQPLTRWGVSYIINKYVDSAKKDLGFTVPFPITPHVFRHSKSVHLLQSGVDLIYIRDFLGHVDCATTEIYARADTEMKRKAIEAAYEDVLPHEELPSWTDDKNLMGFLNSLGS
jgi:site-specific recombinase XerD